MRPWGIFISIAMLCAFTTVWAWPAAAAAEPGGDSRLERFRAEFEREMAAQSIEAWLHRARMVELFRVVQELTGVTHTFDDPDEGFSVRRRVRNRATKKGWLDTKLDAGALHEAVYQGVQPRYPAGIEAIVEPARARAFRPFLYRGRLRYRFTLLRYTRPDLFDRRAEPAAPIRTADGEIDVLAELQALKAEMNLLRAEAEKIPHWTTYVEEERDWLRDALLRELNGTVAEDPYIGYAIRRLKSERLRREREQPASWEPSFISNPYARSFLFEVDDAKVFATDGAPAFIHPAFMLPVVTDGKQREAFAGQFVCVRGRYEPLPYAQVAGVRVADAPRCVGREVVACGVLKRVTIWVFGEAKYQGDTFMTSREVVRYELVDPETGVPAEVMAVAASREGDAGARVGDPPLSGDVGGMFRVRAEAIDWAVFRGWTMATRLTNRLPGARYEYGTEYEAADRHLKFVLIEMRRMYPDDVTLWGAYRRTTPFFVDRDGLPDLRWKVPRLWGDPKPEPWERGYLIDDTADDGR